MPKKRRKRFLKKMIHLVMGKLHIFPMNPIFPSVWHCFNLMPSLTSHRQLHISYTYKITTKLHHPSFNSSTYFPFSTDSTLPNLITQFKDPTPPNNTINHVHVIYYNKIFFGQILILEDKYCWFFSYPFDLKNRVLIFK